MKVYNTQLLINNLGNIVSSYRKVHLFDARIPNAGADFSLNESDSITAGQMIIPPIHTPAGMLGMLIVSLINFNFFRYVNSLYFYISLTV